MTGTEGPCQSPNKAASVLAALSPFWRFQLLRKQTGVDCRVARSQESWEALDSVSGRYISDTLGKVSFISMHRLHTRFNQNLGLSSSQKYQDYILSGLKRR